MSTRSTINFVQTYDGKEHLVAKIYRHSDGYPGTANGKKYGVLPDLHRFFKDVVKQTKNSPYGTRFDDPSYLAAKFVVWQAAENAPGAVPHSARANGMTFEEERAQNVVKAKKTPLNFGSLGIMNEDPSDIEYTYFIDCTGGTGGRKGFDPETHFPAVSYAEVVGHVGGGDDERLVFGERVKVEFPKPRKRTKKITTEA